MTRKRIRAIEENTFAYYGGIARLLGGQFTHTFISQSLPFFWADWPDAGTPGLAEYLNATGIPFV
jgi:hypothetical protein